MARSSTAAAPSSRSSGRSSSAWPCGVDAPRYDLGLQAAPGRHNPAWAAPETVPRVRSRPSGLDAPGRGRGLPLMTVPNLYRLEHNIANHGNYNTFLDHKLDFRGDQLHLSER